MADTFEKFTRCAKVCGLFFLIVLFGCLLVGQADHVTVKQVGMTARNLMQKWPWWEKPK